MNAAARLLNESIMIAAMPVKIQRLKISKQMKAVFSLILLAVLSALILIALEDSCRMSIARLSSLEQGREDSYIRYHQLLLEENTWSSPARIEEIAEKDFSMIQPDAKKVIMLQP